VSYNISCSRRPKGGPPRGEGGYKVDGVLGFRGGLLIRNIERALRGLVSLAAPMARSVFRGVGALQGRTVSQMSLDFMNSDFVKCCDISFFGRCAKKRYLL